MLTRRPAPPRCSCRDEPRVDRFGGRDLARLYQQHAPAVLRLAYVLTGDHDLAEDLVQDAFVRIIGRLGQLRSEVAFDASLRRTVVNVWYGTFRRRRVERAGLARERGTVRRDGDEPDGIDERDQLWHRLASVAPRQRAALVLRYYQDLSEEQAAAVLGCTTRALRSLTARGLETLRTQESGRRMSDLETRLRETLVREANRGDPWPVVTPALLRRARRQRVRTVLAAASTMLALVCVGTWSVRAATPSDPVPPAHHPLPAEVAGHKGDLAYAVDGLGEPRLVIRHRDGSRTVVARERLEPGPCTPDGGAAEGPPCGVFAYLAWAPDGSRLAFLFQGRWRNSSDEGSVGLYVVRRDGSDLRRIGACPDRHGIEPCDFPVGSWPAWSPDSSRIAVSGAGQIWTASVERGGLRPLTRCPPCIDSDPEWSPDGTSIGFVRDDGVYEANVVDGSVWRLAPVDGPQGISWSPDATRIAVRTSDAVYLLDGVDGSGTLRRVAQMDGPQRNLSAPAWSPDGRRLAWLVDASSRSSRIGYHAYLWVTALTGAPPVRLARAPCCLQAPDFLSAAWSPDGRTILMNAPGETLEHEPMGMLLVDVDTGKVRRDPAGGWAPFAAWQPVR